MRAWGRASVRPCVSAFVRSWGGQRRVATSTVWVPGGTPSPNGWLRGNSAHSMRASFVRMWSRPRQLPGAVLVTGVADRARLVQCQRPSWDVVLMFSTALPAGYRAFGARRGSGVMQANGPSVPTHEFVARSSVP